jgi:hypothetical protein
VTRLAIGGSDGNGLSVGSQLFTVRSVQLTKTLMQERFGPVSVIVRYGSEAELLLHFPSRRRCPHAAGSGRRSSKRTSVGPWADARSAFELRAEIDR